MLERLQKIISAAGITSRRAAEQLIVEGRVRVNGRVVTELGTKADALKDHIKVDGKLINPKQPLTYIMLNKPAGYVTTMSDPEGRPTVHDLLKGVKIRVYPVGRLDYNTEGLLLMTNDGSFAHLITHPRHELPKTYLVKVKGVIEEGKLGELEKGVYLDDGKTAPAKIKKIRKEEANSWLEITIHEGKKRQVRRMFDRVGHSVIKLKRVRTGSLTLGDLAEGKYRYLTPAEVKGLKDLSIKEQVQEVEIPKPTTAKKEEQWGRSRERARAARFGPREFGGRRPGGRRPRAEKDRAEGPGRDSRFKGRRHSQGAIAGPGSSGRGAKHSTRDEARQPVQGGGSKGQEARGKVAGKIVGVKPRSQKKFGQSTHGPGARKSKDWSSRRPHRLRS
ncbi:MAG: pseudouridine synthase [Betaproteobacteria bacterium]